MTNNDERLEKYLAEFQPRPIRKLEIPPQPGYGIWLRLAAAAILVLGAGISVWFAYRLQAPVSQIAEVQPQQSVAPAPAKKLNSVELTKLALENTEEFDLYLLQESRNVLPDLQGENSTLRVLVKE